MSDRGRAAALLLVLVLAVALLPGQPDAAVLRTVQTGQIAMTTATVSVGAAQGFVTAVDPARAFVLCSTRNTANNANASRVTCELNSGTALTLTAGSASAATVVRWHVVEFESGVRVQRGVATITATNLTPAAQPSLSPAVDLAKSFVLTSERYPVGSATVDERWTARARLTAGDTLTLDRNEGGAGTTLTVAWQVVEMQGASVQRGTVCIGPAATCPGSNGGTNTATLGTPVDTATSFVLLTRRGGTAVNGIDNRYQARGDFTTTGSAVSGLTFTRAVTSTTANQHVDIAYEVVSLSDGSVVRRGSTTTTTAAGTVTSGAFATVGLTRTIPAVSVSGGSGTSTAQLDETSWTSVVNATTLTFQRAATGTASTLAWQAVQFFRCTSDPLCSVSVQAVSGAAAAYWSQIFLDACGNAPCHALVLRAPGAVNADAPVDGTAYGVGATVGASTVVHNGAGATVLQTAADSGPLTDGTTYCYKVFPKTAATTYVNVSSSATCTATSEAKATPLGGSVAWSHAVSGGSTLGAVIPNFVDSPATLRVFGSSNGSRIFTLDATTGAATSVANTHAPVQGGLSWLVDSGATEVVVGGDQKAYVYALDPVTGVVRWGVVLPTENAADGLAAPISAELAQVTNGDVLFVATRNVSDARNRVFALRLTDGSILWTFNATFTDPMDIAIGQPYVDYAGGLWVTTRAGAGGTQDSLWVLDSTAGALIQSFALGPVDAPPSQSQDGSTVYVGANDGTLYAIDAAGLTVKWSSTVVSPASAVKGPIWEDFDVPGRLYFVTLDGNVYCVQDDGTSGTKCADWPVNPRKPVASGTVSQPIIACPLGSSVIDPNYCAGPTSGDPPLYALFAGGSDGRLYQIRPSDGTIEKQFVVGDGTKALGDLSSQNGGQLFLGDSDGRIYRIGLPLP